MFKPSKAREKERFTKIRALHTNRNASLTLSARQIQLIEDSPLFSLSEKYELILVALGLKLTTEIYSQIEHKLNQKLILEKASSRSIKEIKDLLSSFPFHFYREACTKLNRVTGNQREFVWFQVSVNETVGYFMQNYSDTLTEFEEGILYGFPLSSIRAFAGLIETRHEPTSIAKHYFGGVCSEAYWDEEQSYFENWWQIIGIISPRLKAEGEKRFSSYYSSEGSP